MDEETEADEADFDDSIAVVDDSPLYAPAFTFRDGENDIIPF